LIGEAGTAVTYGFQLMLPELRKLLDFTTKDLDLQGKRIVQEHKKQILKGIDADGNQFASYTPGYAKRKSAGKASHNQKSKKTNPPNLMLTGQMLSKFKYIKGETTGGELKIDYGITDSEQAVKMKDNKFGKFGNSKKRRKIISRPGKARVVAKPNKIGPDAEKAVGKMFVSTFAKNLQKMTKRQVVIIEV